ncbi:SagB/ThcOx family dehydrogenase [Pseudomonas sp. Z5-35]|uniref:SagB/ThcOx family dehydrogenase n=1 Tax=unclassified Pseudomonas TaxID=196821 RepID=UPI003DA80DFB
MVASLSVNPDLRIITFEDFALAYLVGSNKKTKISFAVVEYLLDFFARSATSRIDPTGKDALLGKFICSGFVKVAADDALSKRAAELERYNWKSASDYLKCTHNYPFFEYDKDGRSKDNRRMQEYLADEQEIERFKVYVVAPVAIQGVSPQCSAALISAGGAQGDLENILSALSLSLGMQKEAQLNTGGRVLKKTVPSGGGRHPVEAYLVDFANQTIYHFNVVTYSLNAIKCIESPDLYTTIFGVRNSYIDFDVNFAVVFTCIWERNMFRYREPRTFRSVHLDAGHASMQVETALLKMRYRNQAQYNFKVINFERLLELDPLVEGVMSAVMIGGQSNAA